MYFGDHAFLGIELFKISQLRDSARTLLELAVAGGEDQGAATVKFSAAGSKNS